MSLKYGILGLLNYGPSTGYNIKTFFNDSLAFFWEAQASQIYRELAALEKDGFAKSETVIQYDKPNKNLFSITEKGRKAFYEWMAQPFGNDSFTFKSPMLMKLFFAAGQESDITVAMLKKFSADMRGGLAVLDGVGSHIDATVAKRPAVEKDKLYWTLAADFGYRYNIMAAEWAENAVKEIEKHNSKE